MKKVSVLIKEAVEKAFVSLGYDKKYGMVGISNRPDLCQYQCNGAMAAAKEFKKAPMLIANEVADKLQLSEEGKIFENYGYETEIIAASVRHPMHVQHCALAGADIATVPYKVIMQMINHPLTAQGIEKFIADYKKVFGE